MHVSRRELLRQAALGAACWSTRSFPLAAQQPGQRPDRADDIQVLNPATRVPVSWIIDDSTCLVNLNRFAIPQFAAAWDDGQHYTQYAWQEWPHEIPDAFVRRFGQWCHDHGVKGKYSMVPYPACVGRLDRVLPGWTDRQLHDSLQLVRELMMPNWDIHPEMVTHTWAIDVRTGQPFAEKTLAQMENWDWSVGKSADELAEYLAYALRILRSAGLSCEGITTPGGFGNRVLPELAQATLESCRDVFQAEIPHYFRHLYDEGTESVAPRVEYASGIDSDDPRCVVSIIGCTGDWTGGWDCSEPGGPDRFITADLQQGRLVDVIAQQEPAVMVSHWTGIYFNGRELGFQVLKEVVRRLDAAYDHLRWMKLSEIARYWAARELTAIDARPDGIQFRAPFACPLFTVRVAGPPPDRQPVLQVGGQQQPLRRVAGPRELDNHTWTVAGDACIFCVDLPRGRSQVVWRAA